MSTGLFFLTIAIKFETLCHSLSYSLRENSFRFVLVHVSCASEHIYADEAGGSVRFGVGHNW